MQTFHLEVFVSYELISTGVSILLLFGSPPFFSKNDCPSTWVGFSTMAPLSSISWIPIFTRIFTRNLTWESLGCFSVDNFHEIVFYNPSLQQNFFIVCQNFPFSIKVFNLPANCTFGIFLAHNKLFMQVYVF